jgi:hypothetical protein
MATGAGAQDTQASPAVGAEQSGFPSQPDEYDGASAPAASALHLSPATQQDEGSQGWSWRVAPYLWAAGIDGTLSVRSTDVDVDVDFSDVWESLDAAALLTVEARKGQFTLLTDIVYMGLESDGKTPLGADADAEGEMTILHLAGLFRLSPTSPVELGLGVRYADIETELDLGMFSRDSERDVFDGFVAGRGTWEFAQRWSASLYADIGAGDSDLTWQAEALLGYSFTSWGLGLGYRALGYEFEQGSTDLDFTIHGLVVGAEFGF